MSGLLKEQEPWINLAGGIVELAIEDYKESLLDYIKPSTKLALAEYDSLRHMIRNAEKAGDEYDKEYQLIIIELEEAIEERKAIWRIYEDVYDSVHGNGAKRRDLEGQKAYIEDLKCMKRSYKSMYMSNKRYIKHLEKECNRADLCEAVTVKDTKEGCEDFLRGEWFATLNRTPLSGEDIIMRIRKDVYEHANRVRVKKSLKKKEDGR